MFGALRSAEAERAKRDGRGHAAGVQKDRAVESAGLCVEPSIGGEDGRERSGEAHERVAFEPLERGEEAGGRGVRAKRADGERGDRAALIGRAACAERGQCIGRCERDGGERKKRGGDGGLGCA